MGTLPVFLVAMRLLVHLLFSSLYRLWVVSDEGADALEQVRGQILGREFCFYKLLCGHAACVLGCNAPAGAPAVL